DSSTLLECEQVSGVLVAVDGLEPSQRLRAGDAVHFGSEAHLEFLDGRLGARCVFGIDPAGIEAGTGEPGLQTHDIVARGPSDGIEPEHTVAQLVPGLFEL